MKSNALMSIIVPVFNCGKWISRCIDSIKKQTYSNFQCIVINDGSTDNSLKAIKDACANDTRFEIIDQDNGGVASARNKGIDSAKGEWITFCDADDWLEPNRLDVAYASALKYKTDIVWNAMSIYKSGKLVSVWHGNISGIYKIEDNIVLSSKKYDIGHTPNKLYRAALIKDNNIRFPSIKMSEDLIFNIEAFARSGKIVNISDTLYNYEKHSSSLSTINRKKQNFIDVYSAFLKLKTRLHLDETVAKTFDTFIKGVFNLNTL